jgi:energy-converting hydrogenase Eha subunit A
MRFIAIVTISVCDALIAAVIASLELNFPVPRNKREENSFPAIVRGFI